MMIDFPALEELREVLKGRLKDYFQKGWNAWWSRAIRQSF